MICKKCNEEIDDNSIFCSECGFRLIKKENNNDIFNIIDNMGIISNIGKKHNTNDDFGKIINNDFLKLLIVADGVSCSYNGKNASKLATETVANYFENKKEIFDPIEELTKAINLANERIKNFTSSQSNETSETTIVVCLIINNKQYIAWVGDSRIYNFSKNTIKLLSTDDSWAEEQIKNKKMTIDEAYASPNAHYITQALGMNEKININTMIVDLEKNSNILLCTDGLWNYFIKNEVLLKNINENTLINDVLISLVDKANNMGGIDNITIAIYQNN